MVQIARGKCSHPQCGCTVPGTTEYCSEHCRTASSHTEPCLCRHDSCADHHHVAADARAYPKSAGLAG